MLPYRVIRKATAEDWSAIWPILREVGTAGETLTWDSARTEARARSGWMREPPGRTIVAVDDGGSVIGSANTYPIHPWPGGTYCQCRPCRPAGAVLSWRLVRRALSIGSPNQRPRRSGGPAGARAAPGLAARWDRYALTRRPEHVRGRDLSVAGWGWQSQRNSPEMRLTEPATMTTPNT